MEESTRQNLIMAFNNVLRTSTLMGVVDFQRAALAFGSLLERTDETGVIELGPMYDFLIEQGASQSAVIEVIVFMKSREARFNLTMNMPPQLSTFTQEDIDAIVLNFTSRGATSGTRAGHTPMPGDSARYAPPPSERPSSTPSSDFVPANTSPPKTRKIMLGILAVLVVLGIANIVYSEMTAPPPPIPVTLFDPAGLPCNAPIMTQSTLVCRVPVAFFKAQSPSALEARAGVTKAAITKQGGTRILLYTDEDNKLRKSF